MIVKELKYFLNNLNNAYDESEIVVLCYDEIPELRTTEIISAFAIDGSTTTQNNMKKVIIVFGD